MNPFKPSFDMTMLYSYMNECAVNTIPTVALVTEYVGDICFESLNTSYTPNNPMGARGHTLDNSEDNTIDYRV